MPAVFLSVGLVLPPPALGLRPESVQDNAGLEEELAQALGGRPAEGHQLSVHLGQRLRRARLDKDLTLTDVAKMAGISVGYLSSLEAGRRNNPSRPVLQRLEKALGIELDSAVAPLLWGNRPPDQLPTAIGQRLRRARLDKELKQEEVAKMAGISLHHLSHLEDGTRNPSLPVLQRLEKALGIELRSVAPTPRWNLPPDQLPTAIGQRLRRARLGKGLILEEVAEMAGISLSHLSNLETGKAKPTHDLLRKLNGILDIQRRSVAPPKPASPSAAGMEEGWARQAKQWRARYQTERAALRDEGMGPEKMLAIVEGIHGPMAEEEIQEIRTFERAEGEMEGPLPYPRFEPRRISWEEGLDFSGKLSPEQESEADRYYYHGTSLGIARVAVIKGYFGGIPGFSEALAIDLEGEAEPGVFLIDTQALREEFRNTPPVGSMVWGATGYSDRVTRPARAILAYYALRGAWEKEGRSEPFPAFADFLQRAILRIPKNDVPKVQGASFWEQLHTTEPIPIQTAGVLLDQDIPFPRRPLAWALHLSGTDPENIFFRFPSWEQEGRYRRSHEAYNEAENEAIGAFDAIAASVNSKWKPIGEILATSAAGLEEERPWPIADRPSPTEMYGVLIRIISEAPFGSERLSENDAWQTGLEKVWRDFQYEEKRGARLYAGHSLEKVKRVLESLHYIVTGDPGLPHQLIQRLRLLEDPSAQKNLAVLHLFVGMIGDLWIAPTGPSRPEQITPAEVLFAFQHHSRDGALALNPDIPFPSEGELLPLIQRTLEVMGVHTTGLEEGGVLFNGLTAVGPDGQVVLAPDVLPAEVVLTGLEAGRSRLVVSAVHPQVTGRMFLGPGIELSPQVRQAIGEERIFVLPDDPAQAKTGLEEQKAGAADLVLLDIPHGTERQWAPPYVLVINLPSSLAPQLTLAQWAGLEEAAREHGGVLRVNAVIRGNWKEPLDVFDVAA